MRGRVRHPTAPQTAMVCESSRFALQSATAVVNLASLVLAARLAADPTAEGATAPAHDPQVTTATRERQRVLDTYLRRDVPRSARFLDHGVIAPVIGLGVPHLYRVGVTLGLLDRITVGATAHWLPGQRAPGWSPLASLAFFRHRWFNLGATYFQLLYPPPVVDLDPATISFQRRAHYLLAAVEFTQGWVTGGFDLGWARGPIADPLAVDDPVNQTAVVRDRVGAGLHLRVGTRMLGVIAQVTYPFISAELALEARFGLFERRPRGRWSDF